MKKEEDDEFESLQIAFNKAAKDFSEGYKGEAIHVIE